MTTFCTSFVLSEPTWPQNGSPFNNRYEIASAVEKKTDIKSTISMGEELWIEKNVLIASISFAPN